MRSGKVNHLGFGWNVESPMNDTQNDLKIEASLGECGFNYELNLVSCGILQFRISVPQINIWSFS